MRRLESRLDDPDKRWKFSSNDLKERAYWDDYQAAFEDAVNRCSTPYAPWYVVPANKKWYRNLVVAEALVDALRPYRKEWHDTLAEQGKVARAELEAFRNEVMERERVAKKRRVAGKSARR